MNISLVITAGCGVDGVKVDVQGSSGMFGAGPQLSQRYHESLESSVAKSFLGNTTINCMVSKILCGRWD